MHLIKNFGNRKELHFLTIIFIFLSLFLILKENFWHLMIVPNAKNDFTDFRCVASWVRLFENITSWQFIYNDLSAIANGGLYDSKFTIFNTGTGGTIQAFYWGTTVQINSIFFNRYITYQNYTMSNYGVWMLNNYNDKTFKLSLMGYRNGLEKIILSLKHPFTFMDIGANQGVFSLVAAKNKYCSQLHTFEPNLSVNKFLEKNVKKNNVKNITIHKAAIGSQIGNRGFFVPDNHSGAGRVSSNVSNMEIDCVNRTYLDKFLTNVDELFVKIDVEGNEDEVLQELFNSKLKIYKNYQNFELNISFYL
jgi:FkbM family methyltransferase